MPCNMPSKGERVELIAIKGEDTLLTLLTKALNIAKKIDITKIESLIELEEALFLYLHFVGGKIVSACIEKPTGKILGENAIKLVREYLDDKPLTGYIEVSKITRTALELDLESEPEAKLPNPIPLEAMLGEGRRVKEEKKEVEVKTSGTGHPASQVEEEVPVFPEKLDDPDLMDEIDLATMMVYLLTKSEIVRQSRDLDRLIREARERSIDDTEAFYRVAVELGNGETYNTFYHAGRLCSIIHVLPEGFRARFISPATEDDLKRILEENEGRVERAILYRVVCPECAKVILKGCPEKASEMYEKGKEEKEKREKEARRRFRLLRFLRRT
ncbi:MAG: hypothetical protein F7C33_02255 [Desulfurococcales archaeon]|nr:hypothetical protein [Desulfurococcales archaeon]